MSPPRPPNRLARESSPYLLQHARNPVDWYPWGEEAFAEARRREAPIFLSIGYSTCYWCHVMERESFENESIAELMNERFVCIKVDREERPDIDDLYMAAVLAFRGQGGWPMSVFLEPRGLRPFWAGTYFPPEPKYAGMPTFPQVLEGVSNAWRDQRDEVLKQADKLAEAVRERTSAAGAPVRIGVEQVSHAAATLLRMHDPVRGGFGAAPKFPQPVYLALLLEVRLSADEDTRRAIDAALRTTLDAMALGGLFDQVGGGFHRYSVDDSWTVPHFEKMLYDNAQLAAIYAEAAHVFNDALYRRTARRTIEYVLREMRGPDERSGAFFSAQDAEVNRREGLNYLWTRDQILDALGPDDAALAARLYGLNGGPNFRDPHHPNDPPSNVLRLAARPEETAADLGMTDHEILSRLGRINERLYESRARRDQPHTDDKVIAAWNGLMIGALARAGALLDRPDFVAAAENAATFVLTQMRDDRGGLLRTWRAGAPGDASRIEAFLEDYTCMAHACLELHRTGGDPTGRWLDAARSLLHAAEERFGDAASGAFFDTQANRPDLLARARSAYDGAMPSGFGVMLHALLDMHEMTGDRAAFDRALAALRSASAFIAQTPAGAAASVRALLRMLRADAAAVHAAFANDPVPGTEEPEDFTPVEILAAVERVRIGPDSPAAVALRFRIADGYHINAANPGDGPDAEDLVPLRVHLAHGTGVRVYADYPEGEPYGVDGALRVHRGEIALTVVLERDGPWTGTPVLAVTFQPCRDDACLRPRTVELDVAIDAAE
ncbi:MAG: DUF255 domain-containing protein [Phycisphaeraceae bacterium]|nr:DUF255 domain-containing protein [Phycisphaeraceae bacterium]